MAIDQEESMNASSAAPAGNKDAANALEMITTPTLGKRQEITKPIITEETPSTATTEKVVPSDGAAASNAPVSDANDPNTSSNPVESVQAPVPEVGSDAIVVDSDVSAG